MRISAKVVEKKVNERVCDEIEETVALNVHQRDNVMMTVRLNDD